MKFKIKLGFIVLLLSTKLFSQDENLRLPNITPPSPEAYAMTKYADLQANEFNGMVNYSQNLYTYKAGNLELPITINYSGSGVKVDDLPTWVGINCTLSAGGIITRVIKDIADESAVERRYLTNDQVTFYTTNTIDGTSAGAYMRAVASNNQIDSELDIFQFSFAGYSGSFYLDSLWNAKLLKDDSHLKIDVVSKAQLYNDKYIYITTPDGVKYTFGGSTATEDTTLRYVVDGSVQPDTFQGTTAFYLVSIEHPIYGNIQFEYIQSLGQQIIVTQKTQKRSKVITSNGGGNCATDSSVPQCANTRNENLQIGSLTTVSSRVINPKYLKKIYSFSNPETINFISDSVDNMYFKRVLKGIVVYKDTMPFKTIDFEYQGFQSGGGFGYQDISKRFFLHKIIFDKDNEFSPNTQSGRRNEVFTFDYDGYASIPPRFSYSQDFAGYYNGISNTTGIPKHPEFQIIGSQNFADRTPDFNFASKGTLSRVTYPTGGYTNFEYEAATKAKKKSHNSISLFAYRNQSQYNPNNKLNDGIPQILPDEGVYGIENPEISQTINILVKLKATHNNEYITITPRDEKATLTIKKRNHDRTITYDVDTYTIVMPSPQGGPSNEGFVEVNANFPYGISQGYYYDIEIDIFPGTYSDPVPLEAQVFFEYCTGYTVVEDLGVRLKRKTDFAKDNQPENIKRYYYSTVENINSPIDLNALSVQGEGGVYIKTDTNIDNFMCEVNMACNTASGDELFYQYLNIYSDRFNYSGVQNVGFYENVTISYGGDDFEKGGVEKRFSFFTEYGPTKFNVSSGNSPRSGSHGLVGDSPSVLNDYVFPSVLNGTLLNEKHFKKDGSFLKKILENTFIYYPSENERINNIFSRKEFEAILFEPPASVDNSVSNYTIGVYPTTSLRYNLTTKKVVEYIDPVPLGVEDESVYKKIVTTQDYVYGPLRGLPTRVISSTSESAVNKTIRNYYANETASFTGEISTDNQNAYGKLLEQNRISAPVQTEIYSNSELLNTQRTLYKAWNNNPNMVQPEKIMASKGSDSLEPRIVFSKYNPYGQPMDIRYENGSTTRYYYNNNQVIVKIENYVSPSGGSGGELPDDNSVNQVPQGCELHLVYPKSLVTTYTYNSNNQISIIRDPNCKNTYYEYDLLHRLKQIKDDDGNILKEFENNFKRY